MEKAGHKMRVKRLGKDKDDFFWLCGKIHGLENVSLLTDEEINSVKGDPIKLQLLINDTEGRRKTPANHEDIHRNLEQEMLNYKGTLDHMGCFMPSDRRKLLA
jgi:hypothetical protein